MSLYYNGVLQVENPQQNVEVENTRYVLIGQTSKAEFEKLINEFNQRGYMVQSFSTCHVPNEGVYHSALMYRPDLTLKASY